MEEQREQPHYTSPEELESFRQLAERVLGADWVQRLSRGMGVALRTAQRWAGGQRGINPAAWEWLREQDSLIQESGLTGDINRAAYRAMQQGVSGWTVVAQLREHADRLSERLRSE